MATQAAGQGTRTGLAHRLFVEHPRSLGMTWASHGVGAVKIGARLIGAGSPAWSMRSCPACSPQTAGKTITRIYDHMPAAQSRRGKSGELA